MGKYIKKSALVAEIEKELNTTRKYSTEYVNGKKYALKKILSFLDTLEVKEVDLEEEVDKWYNNEAPKEFENVLYEDIEKCAKHFFELGLSVSNESQKGE